MNILTLILARGGSKSVPRKNIKLICGKPLIAHTISLAKKVHYFKDIFVSSDDLEILKIAKDYGADTILRPKELALDNSSSVSAIIDAIEQLLLQNKKYEIVVLLEPTSPLRKVETIIKSVEFFLNNNYTSLISVTEDFSTFWQNNLSKPQKLFPSQGFRRQDRVPLYKEVGVIYISKISHIVQNRSFLSNDLYLNVTDSIESHDINTELDFTLAEILMRN
jgi:CMP-N,N'-diacetyllegionaminic acid synthase